MIIHVISVSGGKDSTAILLLALARFPLYAIRFIFCDTGNEHEAVYEYLDYLEKTLGIRIERLRANFDREIFKQGNIHQIVEWARTTRGGKQYDIFSTMPTSVCSSSYGLCE